MRRSRPVAAFVAGAALLAGARPAHAQLGLAPVRALEFGTVVVGVPTRVAPSDPVRSGRFDAQAPNGTRVRLAFLLPSQLAGPNGSRLPLAFGPADGLVAVTASSSPPQVFDPRTAVTFVVRPASRLLFFVGGTVSPTTAQAPGTYSGTVTLTLTVL